MTLVKSAWTYGQILHCTICMLKNKKNEEEKNENIFGGYLVHPAFVSLAKRSQIVIG